MITSNVEYLLYSGLTLNFTCSLSFLLFLSYKLRETKVIWDKST